MKQLKIIIIIIIFHKLKVSTVPPGLTPPREQHRRVILRVSSNFGAQVNLNAKHSFRTLSSTTPLW